jgi:nucleoid DNA-binding protein
MKGKKDIASELRSRTLLTKKEAESVIDEIFSIISDFAAEGDDVNLTGFGKFYLYIHRPRPVRNPKTKEEMILEEYVSIKFRPSTKVKNLLKDKSKDLLG